MALINNPLSFIDPDGGMDGEGLGLFDNGQIGRDGRLALQFTTNAFDQFQEMCPTCNSMDIFDLYVSMRKNGVVDPSLMADMATDLVKTGEREERFLDFENNAVHIFQIHELESRPNARFASLQHFGEQGGLPTRQDDSKTVHSSKEFRNNPDFIHRSLWKINPHTPRRRLTFNFFNVPDNFRILNTNNKVIKSGNNLTDEHPISLDAIRSQMIDDKFIIEITQGKLKGEKPSVFKFTINGAIRQVLPTTFHSVRFLTPKTIQLD